MTIHEKAQELFALIQGAQHKPEDMQLILLQIQTVKQVHVLHAEFTYISRFLGRKR